MTNFNATGAILTKNDLDTGILDRWLEPFAMPVEVEIGCRKADILVKLAFENPMSNYIGVEFDEDYCHDALQNAKDLNLRNICIVNMEGLTFLKRYLDYRSVSALHLYHHYPHSDAVGKTGLLSDDRFVKEAHRVLTIGGALRIVTDRHDYVLNIERFVQQNEWWHIPWQPLPIRTPEGFCVGTPVEHRHRVVLEREVYCLQYVK